MVGGPIGHGDRGWVEMMTYTSFGNVSGCGSFITWVSHLVFAVT